MQVLVDTCIWIDFLSKGDAELADLLVEDQVICHPLVLGELITGNMSDRDNTIKDLQLLRSATVASFYEVHTMIEAEKLYGRGLHWNDCNLLASARIGGVKLWTRDKRLKEASRQAGCSYS